MEMITILLVSEDIDYATTFAKCMAVKNNRFLFTVAEKNSVSEEMNINKYDVLLLDGEYEWISPPFIQFVEKRVTSHITEWQQLSLYKYDNVSCFESQVLLFYGLKTGRQETHLDKGHTKMLAFQSSCGGSGKTSIALGLAQELRRFHDKKILYINFEEIESTPFYFRNEEGCRTLSEYLYYLNREETMGSYINSFTTKDTYGVETFAPSEGRNELKTLNIEELCSFFKILTQDGVYDYILVDCDGTLNEEIIWLLSVCDQIILVEKYNEESKQDKFINYLRFCLGESILKKMISILNFVDETGPEYEEVLTVYREPASFKHFEDEFCAYKSIGIDQEFGLGIKELYLKLTQNLH